MDDGAPNQLASTALPTCSHLRRVKQVGRMRMRITRSILWPTIPVRQETSQCTQNNHIIWLLRRPRAGGQTMRHAVRPETTSGRTAYLEDKERPAFPLQAKA